MGTDKPLKRKVCLVTGASRGIGKGIALQLGQAGATIYITGRNLKGKSFDVGDTLEDVAEQITIRGGAAIPVQCDHAKDADIKSLFERIEEEQSGRLDILVNNAYSAVPMLMETMGKKFWETEPQLWDQVNNVGLRNHYICSVYAAKMMVLRQSGLIINISSGAGIHYFMNVPFGVGKEAADRMIADMGLELKSEGVTTISLWPGCVRTELVMQEINRKQEEPQAGQTTDDDSLIRAIRNGESIEFPGKAIVALATDPNVAKKSGKVMMTAELAEEYGFKDIDGRQIVSTRALRTILDFSGYPGLAKWIPAWIKIPYTMLAMTGHKF